MNGSQNLKVNGISLGGSNFIIGADITWQRCHKLTYMLDYNKWNEQKCARIQWSMEAVGAYSVSV